MLRDDPIVAGAGSPQPSEPPGAQVPPSSVTRTAWQQSAGLYALFLVVLTALMWRDATTMVGQWISNETYNHGFIVPLVSGWLLWERRADLAQVAPAPDLRFLPGVALAGAIWFVGWLASIALFGHVGFIFALQMAVPLIFGWEAARRMFFPVAFLVFCVPAGDELVPVLQDFTAAFTVMALKATGIPVFWDGLLISVPVKSGIGNFRVAEACSGVRYLIAGLALGVLFANLCFSSWKRRLAVVVLAFVVPIIANGIRAYGIVIIAHLTDMKHAVGVDHLIYGWLFFSVVTLVLIAVGMTFSDKSLTVGGVLDPVSADYKPRTVGLNRRVVSLLVGLGVIAFAPLWAFAVRDEPPAPGSLALGLPADLPSGWQASAPWQAPPWKPKFDNTDAQVMTTYGRAGQPPVRVFLGSYAPQRDGAELIQYGNRVEGNGEPEWVFNTPRRRQMTVAGADIALQESRLVINSSYVLRTWTLYWANGSAHADALGTKIATLMGKLSGNANGAVLVLATPELGEEDEAVARLQAVLTDLAPLAPLVEPKKQGAN